MVSFPILPLPKPQRSSRFPGNRNRISRNKELAGEEGGEKGASRGEGSEGVRTGAKQQRALGLRSSLVPRPPEFWAVLQENGPEFDALPGFWAVFPALRRGSRYQPRHNPRSEAFASSTPSSAAYETAQNFVRAIETTRCVPAIR